MSYNRIMISLWRRQIMDTIEIGCYSKSETFFYTPGSQAKKVFFYPLCAGHYYCDSTYKVQRSSYDSFLILYIKKGAGYLTAQNKTYIFQAGNFVSIDCYQPHIYGTTKESAFLWLHFDGSSSREYIQMLHSHAGPVCSPKNSMVIEQELTKIIAMISRETQIQDALCSLSICRLLLEALTEESAASKPTSTQIIEDTVTYISNHISENLPLEMLSCRAGLSPFYFTRLFKKETGYTPHNYIIQSRINIAKFYLKSSQYSLKEICFNCGFSTESNFCFTFKKVCGLTPTEYRVSSHSS